MSTYQDPAEVEREQLVDAIRGYHRSTVRRLLIGAAVWALVALAAGLVSLVTYVDAQEQAELTGSATYYVWWGPAALAAWKIVGRFRAVGRADRAYQEAVETVRRPG